MATQRNPWDLQFDTSQGDEQENTWGVNQPEQPQAQPTNQPWQQQDIEGWYNKYLGHGAGAGWNTWADHADAESAIKNSAEGKAYASAHPPQSNAGPVGSAPGPGTNTWGGQNDTNPGEYGEVSGYDFGKLSDPTRRGPGKYNKDVGLFSQALKALNYVPGSGFTPSEATLGELTNWMNAHGGKVSREGDRMTFLDSLDAQGNPYVVDVAGDYNPEGGNGSFTFQDPRGDPDYDIATGKRNPSGGGGGGGGRGSGLPPLGGLPGGRDGGGGGADDWSNTGFQDVFKRAMETINKPVGSAQFEALRQPIDKARRTAGNQANAALAARGMLTGSGEALNAAGRVEERLAPEFATAVQNASVQNSQNAFRNALDALKGGTEYKQVAGQQALGLLDQNRQWNQFLGDFGLKRAQVESMINQGQIDQLLQYYKLWSDGQV